MSQTLGRSGRPWQRARQQVLAHASVCHICGRLLDFNAPPRSRWSPSADHVLPMHATRFMPEATRRHFALDPANLRAAHFGCNSRRRERPLRQVVVRRDPNRW
jgi:5-methylcytosine-specific restriction endonuclease McrA